MPDPAAERTLGQIREVAAWWAGDARAHEVQAAGRPWHGQAAQVSRRQAGDWQALGDLLRTAAAAAATPAPGGAVLALEQLVEAAERLAARLDPDWRRVRTEASADAG